MPGKIFIDTNILVYGFSSDEPNKSSIAKTLSGQPGLFISTQVLLEISNVLRRTAGLTWPQITSVVEGLCNDFQVYTNTSETIIFAHTFSLRYGFSLFDSLIIAAALAADCTTLYSEDLQHGQVIEGRLTVLNPFKLPA
jgi:predicted nucleic acid-binding protein